MKQVLLLLIFLFPGMALAGFPFEASLEEMARSADHMLVGRVSGVDMIDGQGKPVIAESAMTGPDLNNTIRLLIAVDEVLVTNAPRVPKILPVPLANHLHYSLGQIRSAHKGDNLKRLVLLKGKDFSGIKPGVFLRPLEDKDKALEIYRATHR